MDWLDYREKLKIGFNDAGKVQYFTTKILNVLSDIHTNGLLKISKTQYFTFCDETGTPMETVGYDGGSQVIIHLLYKMRNNLPEFLAYYIAFANTFPESEDEDVLGKNQLINLAENMLKSSHILIDLIKDGDGYFIFPKGAEELDNALISQPLAWLSEYPNTRKTYVIALQQYADGKYIRDVADNMRKALEEFLKECFDFHGNFAANIKAVFAYLGEQKIDPQLAGMIRTLLNEYEKLNNEIAKHNDKVDERYLEFLIYQTGIFIRFLLQVKKAEKEA